MADVPKSDDGLQRTCISCKHYRRRINPIALLSLLFNGIRYHRCTHQRIAQSWNPVTGKIKTTIDDRSCRMRRSPIGSHCGTFGANWEPGEKWKSDKKNLFSLLKIIK